MARAVFGCKKLRSWGEVGGCSHHLRRSIPTANADPSRLDDNIWLIGGPDIENRVKNLIDSHGIKPRSNAVLAEEVLLTLGPDFFRPDDPERAGHYDNDRLEFFKEQALKFLKDNFGDRVAAAVLHLDESTPHVQAVIVPIQPRKDGTFGLNNKVTFSPITIKKMRREYQKPFVDAFGVEPCDESAKADNIDLQKYYGTVKRLDDEVPDVEISSRPPIKKPFQRLSDYENEVDNWILQENIKLKETTNNLAKMALQGKLKFIESRNQANAMKHIDMGYNDLYAENNMLSEENKKLAEKLSKEEVSSLRKLNVSTVAERLGYFDVIEKGENAIDLVKRVNEFNYIEALSWLYNEFGAALAANSASEYIERHLNLTAPEKPLTKSQKAKKIVVEQQLSALDCEKYRITAMWKNENGRKIGWNLGKDKETGEEIFFSKEDIINKIPELEVINHDKNVFITPVDDKFFYILIDDLEDEGLKIKEMGLGPCLIQKTSNQSTQAVLKVPKNHVDKDKANKFFRKINKEIGDPKITGLIHPLRLAGFRNVKEKHRRDDDSFPLVKIVEARARLCEKTISSIMSDHTNREDLTDEKGFFKP